MSRQPDDWWKHPRPVDQVVAYQWRTDRCVLTYCAECWQHLFNSLPMDKADPARHEGWQPITVADTHWRGYQCDAIGCEFSGWWQWPIRHLETDDERWARLLADPIGDTVLELLAEDALAEYERGETRPLKELLEGEP